MTPSEHHGTPAGGDGPAPFPRDPDARARGLARMGEVYSFEVGDGPGDFFGYTVEHLFGDVWERPGLSLRDRRLLLLGLMCAEGLDGVTGIQVESALAKGDLSPEDLREVVIFLSHYAGWPKGAGLNTVVETAIARHEKAAARAARGTDDGTGGSTGGDA